MSEEEKKAIEQLKKVTYNNDYHTIDLHTVFGFTTWNYCFEIILNLIEKQQKEIEELKNNVLDYTTIYINGKFDGEKKYKDKIKEKIKEYQEHIDNINNKAPKRKDGKPNNLFNHANREFYKSKVEVLEELLEE